jgi:hypothetical protein
MTSGRYILFSGGFDQRKGLAPLLEAIWILRQVRDSLDLELLILGEDGAGVTPILSDATLADCCRLTGYVSGREKCKYFDDAAVVPYPRYTRALDSCWLRRSHVAFRS